MNLQKFFIEFQDYLAPRLDTYEQAIYLYIFRHSRMLGCNEVTIGFKSARARIATGIGEQGKPMSEGTAYAKIASLQSKGCLTVIRTTHTGRLIKLHLPDEIQGVITISPELVAPDLESMDFFEEQKNRALLLKRENFKCFYTLQALDETNFVVEHVVSRPEGNNSYRNCVAASREANNRKGSVPAEDFLRKLYRESFLSDSEFQERMVMLKKLKAGELKPSLE